MTAASVCRLGSEFDDFLFAPIGPQENGMPLSVLSALARLDIDPWQEAAALARLPREAATRNLTALIEESTDAPAIHLESPTIAARLVALLPRQIVSDMSPRKTVGSRAAVINTPVAMCVVFCVIFVALIIGSQFIIASHQTSAGASSAHRPSSSAVTLQTPTLNPDR
jgi:hypothetical protein